MADEIAHADGAPPAETPRSRADRGRGAAARRAASTRPSIASPQVEGALDPRTTPGAWGEFLRAARRAAARAQDRPNEAYHDIAQSSSVFELVGERYQAAVSQLALGRLAREAGARSTADRHLPRPREVFQALGAHARPRTKSRRALAEPPARRAPASTSARPPTPTTRSCGGWWTPSVLPDLLARELRQAVLEAVAADVAVVFVTPAGRRRCGSIARAGGDADAARTLAAAAAHRRRLRRAADRRASRSAATPTARARSPSPSARPLERPGAAPRAHDGGGGATGLRPVRRARAAHGRPRSPPANVRSSRCCPASSAPAPAMQRVVEQIQRLQGNDLTVLITGESGTGKELVARAIHVGSLAQRRHLPALQLHDDHARARRQPAVRPSPRRVHRRRLRSARPDPRGRRRHAVPRRSRRPAVRRAAEAAALPRAGRDHAGRRDPAAARSTCACLPPPTPTSNSASPKASSARISTTG